MSPRVAVASLHSHEDRSFLDDRILALVVGDLRARSVDADLVVATLDTVSAASTPRAGAFDELVAALRAYDVIVYERVWNRRVVEELRAALPGATFVSCEGEHALEDPPADYVCAGDLRSTVPALVAHLGGDAPLPRGVRVREESGWREGLGKVTAVAREFRPVLRPRVIGPPRERTFSIEGNAGCPYGTDARENPIYAGTDIPDGYGRGCAFCTTGNRSESAPPAVTADKVMEQLRFVRREAPELTRLVLKDQNPFGWLTEVVERCAEEGLGGFSLLLETRADWFLRNRKRFERALAVADTADIRICPFLVGIESFSQAELDRFNKGTSAAANEELLGALDAWDRAHASMDLSHAAFGFVLLTPWTQLDDLRRNLEAVERTGFDRLRGHLLVSKARLYPDTALYYLAARDGLLIEAHERPSADNSRRYGYFPETPWRFVVPEVARFAALAAELTDRYGGRDEVRLWRALLEAIETAPDDVSLDSLRLASAGEEPAGSPGERRRGARGKRNHDAVVRLSAGCDLGCPMCSATGPAPTADPRAVVERGGRRLTLRGPIDETRALLRLAIESGWADIVVHTHGADVDVSLEGANAVLVPLFSHVDTVHDRIAGVGGALDRSLAALARFGDAGLRVEVEIPLLPRRLAHPRSILERARAATAELRAARFVTPRGDVHAQLVPPAWSEGATLLAEALTWCERVGVDRRIGRDQGIPFCALQDHPELLDEVFRFDPHKIREPARNCVRPAACDDCACRAQCPGTPAVQVRTHGERGLRPFAQKPSGLYHQRTSAPRKWTETEKLAARRAGLVVLRPTVNCNQDCVFCSANETSANVWASSDEMLKQIARAARRGVTRLAFGGGEPTLAKDLPSYVSAARRLGIEEVELVTNGTLLDREARVRALADAGLTHAFVSMHAHDEMLSRHLTQKVGDFERTVRATELLVGAGVKTAINHVITRRNARYLTELVRFVHGRFAGRVAISLAFVTPQYKALENLSLMPRMSEVRPHLEAALAEALAIGQPCWVGARQGMPPCQLGAFRAWSDIFEHADAGLAEDAPQKIRGPQCDRCRYTDVCTGVWRPYAERFGLDELTPVEGPAVGEAERAAIKSLKTEPWGLPPADFARLPEWLRDREAEAALEGVVTQADVVTEEDFVPHRSRPLRLAILGSGERAAELARALRDVPRATLDAVASPHAPDATLDVFGGCPTWRDAGDALEEMRPDAVAIAVRPSAQAALVRLAIERGVPVLYARPLSGDPGEARALVELADERAVALVPAYELACLPDLATSDDVRIEHRVGPRAPLAWSRRGLGTLIEDTIALALRVLGQGNDLEVDDVAFRGDGRPERVRVTLAGASRRAEITLLLDGGESEVRLWASEREVRLDPRATAPMLASFRDVVLDGAAPLLSARDGLVVSELTRAALDALATAGLPFERASEPRHVASRAFRDGG